MPIINNDLNGKKTIKWYIGIFIWSFVGASNGIIQIILSVFPAIGAIIWIVFLKKDHLISKNNLKEYILAGAIVAGTAAGLIFYKIAMRGVPETNYAENTGTFTLATGVQMLENFRALPSNWMGVFWISDSNVPILSKSGFLVAVRLLMFITVTVIPFVMLALWKKLGSAAKFIMMNHILISAVCCATSVLTVRTSGGSRLLYNMAHSAFIVTAVFLTGYVQKIRWKNVIALGIAGISLFSSLDIYRHGPYVEGSPILAAIEKEGLEYGFARFWNANVNTVRSGGKIKVREAEVSDQFGFIKGTLQTDALWYNQPIDASEFFVLLTNDDSGEFKRIGNCNSYLIEKAKRIVELEGYNLLIYDISFWNELFNPSVRKQGVGYSGMSTTDACRITENGIFVSETGKLTMPSAGLQNGNYIVKVYGENLGKEDVSLSFEGKDGCSYKFKEIDEEEKCLVYDVVLNGGYNYIIVEISNNTKDEIVFNQVVIGKDMQDVLEYNAGSGSIQTNGSCELADNAIGLMPGGLVYGPYCTLYEGEYTITVYGENLDNANIYASYDFGGKRLDLVKTDSDDKSISFEISVDSTLSNAEIVVSNDTEESIMWTGLIIRKH